MPLGFFPQHVQNSSSEADTIKPSAISHITHNPSSKRKQCHSKPKSGRKYVFLRPVQRNAGCSYHVEYKTGSKMPKHANASKRKFP